MSARAQRRAPATAMIPAAALALGLVLAALASPDAAFSFTRGSVGSVNRGGGSWQGQFGSGTTSRSSTANASSRSTSFQGRGGESATGTRNVTRSGDEVNVNRDVQASTGASKSSQKTYTLDDGHVESVDRSTQATNRYGQSANWQGSAERSGYGWEFEGQGTNRYGQKVSADGYGARGPYGSAVVADVEGGRYGDRTVVAGHAYGGPVYAASLPYGARPYPYHGNSYYHYSGVYYRSYSYHGAVYYGYMPPPWGAYYTTVPVGAIALTVAGAALLYADGTYYQTTYVQGATQYVVVAPPAGAAIPGTALPADRVAVTISGVTYYLYGNSFYKRLVVDGKETFVVVTKPAGLVSVAALPDDFVPLQKGNVLYFRSGDRYFVAYLDPGGQESFVVVDPPAGAQPAFQAAAAPPAAPAPPPPAAPAAAPTVVSLKAAAGTPVTARVAVEISSKTAQAGQRFQGYLDVDLVAAGRVLAPRGARVYGMVLEAKAGTGSGGQPLLALALTDIEIGGRVVPVSTEPNRSTAAGAKHGKKVVGGMALGAGIGGIVNGGEGAAVGAIVGTAAGAAAAAGSPSSQVAVAAGTALEFRLAAPLSVDVAI